jgi:hypothetical protein
MDRTGRQECFAAQLLAELTKVARLLPVGGIINTLKDYSVMGFG